MSGPNAPPQIGQQDYRTPPDFLARALNRAGWSRYEWDLACTEADCIGAAGGYALDRGLNALDRDWRELGYYHTWCNPPFAKSGVFARKAAESGISAHLLVPVALGTRWWRQFVHGKARVVGVGRIKFLRPDGTPMPAAINRDCALLWYGPDIEPGYDCESFAQW